MVPFNATVDASKARHAMTAMAQALPGAQRYALEATARVAAREAARTTLFQDRTGKLRQSIEALPATERRVVVRANTAYAQFVENGSRPHVIQGKNGGLLRFTVNGTRVFRKSVHHPGARARPFMKTTADAMAPVFASYLTSAVDAAFASGGA